MRVLLFLLMLSATLKGQTSPFDVARKGTLAEMQQLYANDKTVVNAVDSNGSSMLVLACYRGNKEVAAFLISHGADVNYNSGRGTALMAAVMRGDNTIVQALLDAKANPDCTDPSGKTALIYAAFFNKEEIITTLLKAAARRDIKDADGRTALDYARFNQNTKMIIQLDQ